MISSKVTTQTHVQDRHGKNLVEMQEKVEKILNLKTLLNLIKQSNTVLNHFGTDFESIKETIAALEYQVNGTIDILKQDVGMK